MFLGHSSMEFAPFRPKAGQTLVSEVNKKKESKLGFQVKMTVFEGLMLR
jgi:hypothetical protein